MQEALQLSVLIQTVFNKLQLTSQILLLVTQCHLYHLKFDHHIIMSFLQNSPGGALKVLCPYFAGTEVLNGSFNGTTLEDCGGRTVTGL